MRILGIDPGLATVGYGVVEFDGVGVKLIDYGVMTTPAGMRLSERLDILYDTMSELIDMYEPTEVAFEELFFAKNVKTGISVAHARGVLVCAAKKKKLELHEYTPLQVKQAVAGYGRATKQQVQSMVMTILSLSKVPKPDDAADAVAVALCHIQSRNFSEQFRL